MRIFLKRIYLSIAALFLAFSASAQEGGSTSKQFAAASILLLAGQGKLSLDDDVRKHIPDLSAYQKPITIRHLIHHTSGLRDYTSLFSLAGVNFDDTTTEKDALDLIVRQKGLNFTPGDEWLYSNSGYFLLSIIIKRASGKSLAVFTKENIFDLLGMKHTLILDDHKKIVPMRATGYSPHPRGGFQTEMSNFEQTGDGAVQTSVEDLLLWDQNFYEPKVGVYRSLTNRELRRITLRDGKLWIDDLTMLRSTLKPLSETRFIAGPDGSWVEFKSAGGKTQLDLSRNNRNRRPSSGPSHSSLTPDG